MNLIAINLHMALEIYQFLVGNVWQLGHTSNGYFDKLSKQFRKLENWSRYSDVQGPMDKLQDHGDKPGSFEEKISDVTTRHQTFRRVIFFNNNSMVKLRLHCFAAIK